MLNWPMLAWCAIGAALFAMLYLLAYGLRYFDHWLRRRPQPADRVWAFVVICALLGAFAGGVCSAFLDKVRPCQVSDRPIGTCFIPERT